MLHGVSQSGRVSLGLEAGAGPGSRPGVGLGGQPGKYVSSASGGVSSLPGSRPPRLAMGLSSADVQREGRGGRRVASPAAFAELRPSDPETSSWPQARPVFWEDRERLHRDTPEKRPRHTATHSASSISLPPSLLALLDPSSPGTLPAPGSIQLRPEHNRELDKLATELGRGRNTWRRALGLLPWLVASGHRVDDRLCTSMIRLASSHGDLKTALYVYDWMRTPRASGGAGLSPSVFTYTAAARAALNNGDPAAAQHICEEAGTRSTSVVDCRLATAHLEACSRTGDTAAARRVYSSLLAAPEGSALAPSVHAFTAAMRALPPGEEALRVWDDMLARKCRPTAHAYAAAITTCGPDWRRAWQLFEGMMGETAPDARPDVVACTAMIGALARTGQAQRAQRVLTWMRSAGLSPNARTYTSLLTAYANAGDWVATLGLLRDLQAAGSASDSVIIRGGSGSITTTAGPHPATTHNNNNDTYYNQQRSMIAPNAYTYSALIKTAADQGRVDAAEAVFATLEMELRYQAAKHAALEGLLETSREIHSELLPTYSTEDRMMPSTSMVEAEADAAAGALAVAIAALALPDSRSPSPGTKRGTCDDTPNGDDRVRRLLCMQLGAALGGVDESSGDEEGGKAISTYTTRSLREGAVARAASAWENPMALLEDGGGQRAGSSANLMVDGTFHDAKDDDHALQQRPTPLIAPDFPRITQFLQIQNDEQAFLTGAQKGTAIINEVVCGAMLVLYDRARLPDRSVALLKRAQSLGVTPNTAMLNAVLGTLAKAGRVPEAAACLRATSTVSDINTYEILIAGWGLLGEPKQAEAAFSMLLAAGFEPRNYAYNGLIAAYANSGDIHGALDIADRMRGDGAQLGHSVHQKLQDVSSLMMAAGN